MAKQMSGKAVFDHTYNQGDPRPYFQTLQTHEYQTPAHAQPVFSALVAALRAIGHHGGNNGELVALDLCCSYGINAALLCHKLTLDALRDHYCSPALASLSSDELATADALFYLGLRRPSPVQVVGVDAAPNAVAYAVAAGLLSQGFAENLEVDDPTPALSSCLAQVGLITVTGGVRYLSEQTFTRILRRTSSHQPPWVAAFVLRCVEYEPIAAVLASHGLVTEKLAGHTFPQRRFVDEAERSSTLAELDRRGIDSIGKEADGWYHTDFYLSRPSGQRRASLEELIGSCLVSATPTTTNSTNGTTRPTS